MLITIQTDRGPQQVRVCDYCQTVCISSGRFCSGRCARQWDERQRIIKAAEATAIPPRKVL